MKDPEVEAISAICSSLQSLPDDASRERVLNYAASRFNLRPSIPISPPPSASPPPPPAPNPHVIAASTAAAASPQSAVANKELSGIAKLTDTGILKITIRDLKASSRNDAAIRLAHITILANEILTGQQQTSSPNTLVPILRDWRAYDSNTRNILAKQKGIVRDGEMLSLDQHARADAEQYMEEALNPTIEGSWSPSGQPRTTKRGKTTKKASPKGH